MINKFIKVNALRYEGIFDKNPGQLEYRYPQIININNIIFCRPTRDDEKYEKANTIISLRDKYKCYCEETFEMVEKLISSAMS